MSFLSHVVSSSNQVERFNPTSIAGCSLWLDGNDASTLYDATSGGNFVAADGTIARWEDKSGLGFHATQSTSTARFQRKTGIVNGRDVVLSSGASKYMRSSMSLAGEDNYTIFLVLRSGAVSTATSALRWQETSTNYVILPYSTNARHANSADGGTAGLATNFAANTWTLLTARRVRSSLLETWKNGVFQASRAAATSAIPAGASALTLGRYNVGASEYFSGEYAEVLVYKANVNNTDRATIETYLINKWGL